MISKKYTGKFLLIFLFVVASFFVAQNALAVSGACSSHGGVNCTNADFDGSVICNDGWADSSTSFYSADECKNFCIPPVKTNCSNESEYATLYQQLLIGGSLRYSSSGDGILTACRDAITKYQSERSAYQNCLAIQNSQNTYTPPVYDATTSCKKQFGQYSIPSSSKSGYCSCESGYVFGDGDQCVLLDIYCQQKNGTNSKYDQDVKGCVDQAIQCSQKHGLNTIFKDSICSCAVGYKMDSQWQCVPLGTKTIPQKVLDIAKSSSCFLLSIESERALCVDYQLHQNLYTWVVHTPNSAKQSELPSIKIPETDLDLVAPVPTPKKNEIKKEVSDIKFISSTTPMATLLQSISSSSSPAIQDSNKMKTSFWKRIQSFIGKLNPFLWF